MRGRHVVVLQLALFLCLVLGGASLPVQAEPPEGTRERALQHYNEGRYRDAYVLYEGLVLHPDANPLLVGSDLDRALACLGSLNSEHEADGLREQAVEIHGRNWRLLWAVAESYTSANHHGYVVAGEYRRGDHRGGGRYVNSSERDRARALQLMETARTLLEEDPVAGAVAEFHFRFAAILLGQRGYAGAWRLQYLTDLSELPDVEEGYGGYRYGGGDSRAAPVDGGGNPVFHNVPESWDDASSDGERWRWMLERAGESDPASGERSRWVFASFLHQQFGVQTMASFGDWLRRRDGGPDEEGGEGTWSLHTLGEEETIARLASGAKRFSLPLEFNFIRLMRDLVDSPGGGYGASAVQLLAQIFENRRQYGKAVEMWRLSLEHFDGSGGERTERRIRQITGNWGEFEAVSTHPAGEGATVDYRFRNGRRVSFEAREIIVEDLLRDVKEYLRGNPRNLDHDRMNISRIGYRLVREGGEKYLGRRAAQWDLSLEPRSGHFDRRVTVATPLQKAGAYLLTARMEDGNENRIVLWVSDTVIVHKRLDGEDWLYVADAVTGAPLEDLKVRFFGYRQERTDWQKVLGRRYNILTREFSYRSDREGQLVPNQDDFSSSYRWLVTAKGGGRLAYLGWSAVWQGRRHDAEYNQRKTYVITDRPVYRPAQEVRFKFWVRQARYDQEDVSRFAGERFTVRIENPRSEKVYEEDFVADEWGGMDGALVLPQEAVPGTWRISIPGYGGGSFRVEEYKKPEFEVKVTTPDDPVRLGGRITAAVEARYYFGAPVTEATVKYRILRTPHEARWYPGGEWDWLYGSGYWWFQGEYTWYPKWEEWGVRRPSPWWLPPVTSPPEVVAEAEAEIGEDGRVEIGIDTSFAAEIHGDTDHRYEIVAEVTDRSRRTIVGRGSIVAARRAFRVYAWVDRGYYRTGDVVRATLSARRVDGKPVRAEGEARLMRISYVDGKPVETPVGEWKVETDSEGKAKLQIKASRAGQYRLACTLMREGGEPESGGYLFVVRGAGFDGKEYRFNEIELVPDKREYAPGDTVRLMVSTDRPDSTVVVFTRPANGVYLRPRILRITGKSGMLEIPVGTKDMPNFFVEAFTVAGGKIYSENRELIVPPSKRVLNVDVLPSKEEYRPGERARVAVMVTDMEGRPFSGSAVMSVYDASLEYISGGANVPEIRDFFWKWRRRHQPRSESSLDRRFERIATGKEESMRPVGVFGHLVADEEGARLSDSRNGRVLKKMKSDAGGMQARAPMSSAMGLDVVSEAAGPAPMVEGKSGEVPAEAEAAVRSEFADTAFWDAALVTDEEGKAEIEFQLPENLTEWKIRTWVLGHGTVVGEGTAAAVTAKKLLVRLQAPRFFVEKDEVVLSANIHNYLEGPADVRALLELEGPSLELSGEPSEEVVVPPGGEVRVDWRVRVVREGEALVRVKALSAVESDGMEMRFPVYVHGMLRTESFSGRLRPDEKSRSISIGVPMERRIEQSRLEVRFSPTLAGAMVDALPYLVEYPYGCTEQTLNRFLPTVITQKVLREMGLDLARIRDKRTNLNSQETGDDRKRAGRWKRWKRNPVFDEEVVREMTEQGVQRLAAMQLSDGGWGWFSGWGERSTPHTTATVVRGLQMAAANGASLHGGMLERGVKWLEEYRARELTRLGEGEEGKSGGKRHADNLDALAQMVLVDAGMGSDEMNGYLFRDRSRLSVYALSMFGLSLHRQERTEELAVVMERIEQYLVQDEENQTAWLDLPGGYWWYWYGSEFEAHAYYLKLLAATEPGSGRAAALVKYLLNNRRHGGRWNSTRDTALCIEALAEYLRASGEMKPDMTVEIYLDGRRRKSVRITQENLFAYDNVLLLEGTEVTGGGHTLEVKRKGEGPVYFNAYITNFTLEEHIARAGLEIRVERKLYRLEPREKSVKVSGSRGQAVDQKVEKYRRIPLGELDTLRSGDLVEVELEIESKNDYEYVVLEDMKGAGFEAVEVRSGYGGNDMGAYMELRDEKVAFFLASLARGRHSLSYRLRAEIPGRFSALPARAHAMYAPELRGNSEEIKLRIRD